jgi:hypothetical protein
MILRGARIRSTLPRRFSADQRGGESQNPARHNPEQHCAAVVQLSPSWVQVDVPPSGNVPPPPGGIGGSHDPFVQLDVQQSAPVTHAPAVGVQATAGVQVCVAASQCLSQQSPSVVHVACNPSHAPGGRPQRPSTHKSSSFVAPQHPDCGPDPQFSPVGRHVEFATSTMH